MNISKNSKHKPLEIWIKAFGHHGKVHAVLYTDKCYIEHWDLMLHHKL